MIIVKLSLYTNMLKYLNSIRIMTLQQRTFNSTHAKIIRAMVLYHRADDVTFLNCYMIYQIKLLNKFIY